MVERRKCSEAERKTLKQLLSDFCRLTRNGFSRLRQSALRGVQKSSENLSIFSSLALSTPIHGFSYVATTRYAPLKVFTILLLAAFAYLTAHEMGQTYENYLAEPAFIETSLIRQLQLRLHIRLLLRPAKREGVDRAGEDNETPFRAQLNGDAPAELWKWNSTDEAALPSRKVGDTSILYAALALGSSIAGAEFRLLPIASALANAAEHEVNGSVQAYLARWRRYVYKPNPITEFLREAHDLFTSKSVHLAQLMRTAAVLFCQSVSPEIVVEGRRLETFEICRKSSYKTAHSLVCGFGNRQETFDATLAFKLEMKITSNQQKPIILATSWANPQQVEFLYWLRFIRNDVTIYDSAIKVCSSAFSECRNTNIERRRRDPMIETFARDGDRAQCLTEQAKNESRESCLQVCQTTFVEKACGCRLTISSPESRSCVELCDSVNTSKTAVPCLLECYALVLKANKTTIEACEQGCKERFCRAVISIADPSAAESGVTGAREVGRSILEVDPLRFTSPLVCHFKEFPAMDTTTFVFLLGGSLGTWFGATFLALAYFALATTTSACGHLRARRHRNRLRAFEATDQAVEEAAGSPDRYYFTFLDTTVSTAGIPKLLMVFALLVFAVMQTYDTVSILEAFFNERTQVDIRFVESTRRVFEDFPDQTICLPIGVKRNAFIPDDCTNVHDARTLLAAKFSCMSLLMRLEQHVFFSKNPRFVPREALRKCRNFLRCVGGGDESQNFSALLGTELCSAMHFNVQYMKAERGRLLTHTTLCLPGNIRWIGPYAPFRNEDSICFALPADATLMHVLFPMAPENILNSGLPIKDRIMVHFSATGGELFLKYPDIIGESLFHFNVSMMNRTSFQLHTQESGERLNLRRRPCSNDDKEFSCVRNCRSSFLRRHCEHESYTFGAQQTLGVLLRGIEDTQLECLHDLANGTDATLERCLEECHTKISCTFSSTVLLGKSERYVRLDVCPHCYQFDIIWFNKILRLESVESLVVSDVETLLAIISGSTGLWHGGSAFALIHLFILLAEYVYEHLVRPHERNERAEV